MADEGMVALREALGKIMESEHAHLLRESVALVVREVMELEACERAGAERYERSAERSTYRNGYRQREWDTRVGTIELAIPRLRQGSYLPSFLNARKRSEQALLAVVMEAYTMACRRARSSGRSSSWGWRACPRARSVGSVRRWMSASRSSVAVRWRAPISTSGWTPGSRARETEAGIGAPESAAGGLCGARNGPTRGDRAESRRGRIRGRVARLSARARGARAGRRAARHQRRPPGPRERHRPGPGAQWQRCCVHFVRDMLGHVPRQAQPMLRARSSRSSPRPTARAPARR